MLTATVAACGAAAPDGAANPGAVRILPLGDSITEGNLLHDSYRRPLWHSLTRAGYAVDFVGTSRHNHWGGPPTPDFDLDHEGHWGWRADQVRDKLPEWLPAMPRPDIALIHLGSNDLFQDEPPEQVVEELAEIIDLLRGINPEIVLLVAKIIPASGTEAITATFNRALDDLTTRSTDTSPIRLVDQFTGFDPARHTYDGVHPNQDGEALMAERWHEALAPWLTAAPR